MTVGVSGGCVDTLVVVECSHLVRVFNGEVKTVAGTPGAKVPEQPSVLALEVLEVQRQHGAQVAHVGLDDDTDIIERGRLRNRLVEPLGREDARYTDDDDGCQKEVRVEDGVGLKLGRVLLLAKSVQVAEVKHGPVCETAKAGLGSG